MKKGQSISIGILVLLVASLVFSSVVIFLLNSKNSNLKIYDARVLERIYMKENLATFYLKKAGEDALKKTYESDEEKFDGISTEEFIFNFKTEFAKYSFESSDKTELRRSSETPDTSEEYLKNLQKLVEENNFVAVLDDNKATLEVKNFVLKENYETIEVEYSPRILLEINRKV